MKNFWEKYWVWSDKINAPFQKHKDRIVLYVVLSQSVIVTIALLRLANGIVDDRMQMICKPDFYKGIMHCVEIKNKPDE
jgi:hypothetical protein